MIPHVDRIPKEILENGAVKYGVYDEKGVRLRSEYIRREDEPIVEGTVIGKRALDELLAASGTTTGDASTLHLTQDGFALFDGAAIRFKLHTDSGATPTINVNGTGAKSIMATKYKPLKAGTPAGTWLTAVYSSTFDFFVLQGSGAGDTSRYGNGIGKVSTFELCLVGNFNPYFSR